MMKLKILTISKPYVNSAYRDKLRELSKSEKVSIGLLCPQKWAQEDFEGSEADENFWVRTVPIYFNGQNHFHFYRTLEKHILDFGPDLLNVEEEHYSLVTWQIYRLARKHKIKSIFYTWQNIHKNYPPPFSWIESFVFNNSVGAIAGNNEAEEVLRRKGFQGPISVIPQMGVDFNKFKIELPKEEYKKRLHFDENGFYIGYFGRMIPEKGLSDLLHAFSLLKAERPLYLVLVGGGPEFSNLKELAENLGVAKQVIFFPQVTSKQIPAFYRALDILCLPSRTKANWKEQFGRVLVEAMAAQVIPLGSSSGEIPNVLGDQGLVFPEGNPKEMASKIQEFIFNNELRHRYQVYGLDRVLRNYTQEKIAEKFLEFWLHLVV